jgi:hypothetical protein
MRKKEEGGPASFGLPSSLSPKRSLILVPHQFSLFSVFVFSDFLASLLDYAAHSVSSSSFKSYPFTLVRHEVSIELLQFLTAITGEGTGISPARTESLG